MIYVYILIKVKGWIEFQSVCNYTSEQQNLAIANLE